MTLRGQNTQSIPQPRGLCTARVLVEGPHCFGNVDLKREMPFVDSAMTLRGQNTQSIPQPRGLCTARVLVEGPHCLGNVDLKRETPFVDRVMTSGPSVRGAPH